MSVVLRDLDQQRVRFEAMIRRVGERDAKLAFSRALTHEGRKGYTAVRRALRNQTSAKAREVSAATRFRGSSTRRLTTMIEAGGGHIPLKEFGARQFSYGVRAKVWGRTVRLRSAFIVDSMGGNVFKRTTSRRLPVEKMWGPSIPKEMVKDQSLSVFESSAGNVADRAMHELNRILRK